MWKVSQIICIGALAGMSVSDMIFRKVPEGMLVTAGVGALLYQCMFRTADGWLVLAGAGVGGCFLLLSKVTKEGIGYGDNWGILILGIYLGVWNLLGLLLGAFVLLLPAGMILFMTGRCKRRTSLPFYPFLTGGYILVLLTGVG